MILDASFLESDCAVMIPKTSDGRVLFAVPWHNKVVVGTTDTLMEHTETEPVALEQEIPIYTRHRREVPDTGSPSKRCPLRIAGLRPLAAPRNEGKKTKEIIPGAINVASGKNPV